MKPVLHLPSEIYVGVSPIWLCRAKVIDTWSFAYNRSTSYCSRWVETRWGRSGFHWLYVRCRRGPMCPAAGICSTTEEIAQKITKNTWYLTLDPWKTLLRLCKCWRHIVHITSHAQHSGTQRTWWQVLSLCMADQLSGCEVSVRESAFSTSLRITQHDGTTVKGVTESWHLSRSDKSCDLVEHHRHS